MNYTTDFYRTKELIAIKKFLLTSAGIKNTSIHDALVDLLGKPITESSALFIPTGIYPFPDGAGKAWNAICGRAKSPLCELGWKSLGILELTALTTIREESWVPMIRETDALLVWGGDVLYLCHWMRQSGLADLLPSLSETVYVGVSAGSIVVTPYNCDAEFDLEFVPTGSDMALGADRALGLVVLTQWMSTDGTCNIVDECNGHNWINLRDTVSLQTAFGLSQIRKHKK